MQKPSFLAPSIREISQEREEYYCAIIMCQYPRSQKTRTSSHLDKWCSSTTHPSKLVLRHQTGFPENISAKLEQVSMSENRSLTFLLLPHRVPVSDTPEYAGIKCRKTKKSIQYWFLTGAVRR